MDWNEFVDKCEKTVPGSGEKLNRIRENKEAEFTEEKLAKLLLEKTKASNILVYLFVWRRTLEGIKSSYWDTLHEKMRYIFL